MTPSPIEAAIEKLDKILAKSKEKLDKVKRKLDVRTFAKKVNWCGPAKV